ncbi:MAG TPA: hypothetical protein VII06_39690 [Chloroflexota bacterium]|jgi:hypothetical protein
MRAQLHEARPAVPRHARAGFVGGVLLLLLTAVLLPIAVGSIIVELVLPAEATVFFLTEEPPRPTVGTATPRASANYLNIAVVEIDEAKALATLRISGNRTCAADCPDLQLALFSLSGALARRVGLPPSATVSLPAHARQISTTVELPVGGQPSRYPFDTYDLVLAVDIQAIQPDGTISPLRLDNQTVQTYLTLQSQVQRLKMSPPLPIDPGTLSADTDLDAFLYVRELKFWRPLYLPVLAVLLVLLITGAAAYSVRTQPVQQLLLGVGSLVLGIWGIRSILVPGTPPYGTAVDLALSFVILLLLGGIIARGLLYAHQHRRDTRHD